MGINSMNVANVIVNAIIKNVNYNDSVAPLMKYAVQKYYTIYLKYENIPFLNKYDWLIE